MFQSKKSSAPVVPRELLVPFLLVTVLFPLWGFANDITNPMVAAFKNILLLTNFESSWVQGAFYGGYALMSIPAAVFIKRYSYKKGILIGLALYALGCLMFIPSGMSLMFVPFLFSYLIMTCGLSFLETTANPYILSMGDESTATRRLNLAQSFNPMGSILGMFVASMFILVNLNGTSEGARRMMVAASKGTPVHAQVLTEQEGVANDLAEIVGTAGWEGRKKLLKKAKEQSESLHRRLELVADARMDEALALEKALAAEPQPDKFASAVAAVAEVLQLREATKPTVSQARRDALFGGADGLELAKLLGAEEFLLGSDAAFAEVKAKARELLAASGALRAEIAARHEGKAPEAGASAAAQAGQLVAGLAEASAAMGRVPAGLLDGRRAQLAAEFSGIQKTDLTTVVWPYALMGVFLVGVLILFAFKLPAGTTHEGGTELHLLATFGRLVRNFHYVAGVVAQTFYVGAQIMCWTFIIQYAELELGLAKSTAQNCNILAMIIFVSSRFICTFVLHYVKPGMLLAVLAVGGVLLTAGTIFVQGYAGLYCLIGVSACMSLMFPTIYGIALEGLGDDAKLASAGLILAIGGGCLMPVMQGAIIDLPPLDLGFMELASVRASFVLPLICFVVIALYGLLAHRTERRGVAAG